MLDQHRESLVVGQFGLVLKGHGFTGRGKSLEGVTFPGLGDDLEVDMRGEDDPSVRDVQLRDEEQRIAADHPARATRALVDRALQRMDGELGRLYPTTGRPSIVPERLQRGQLLRADL